jgi:predicted unusual protein kinase regulating ubiquinone biosynthesis (AarF/ABC1/UbiB family)
MTNPEPTSLLRAGPRLMQILRVLARHKILCALRGKSHWPPPQAVRETVEELGLTFIKFGQVLALRRDLLPDAYLDELELLHDQLPAMAFAVDYVAGERVDLYASENVNRAALLVDIKAALYDIHRSELAEVSIGDAFESLAHAGSRNGVHNPGEFVMLTRAFVILEAMIRQLAPDHNYMDSFREEISRLTAQHFSLARIKDKTSRLARDLERLLADAPGDTRRALRRVAEGDLGRVQAPVLEALAARASLNLERLARAIMSAALVVGGSLLLISRLGGWHHMLGVFMVTGGMLGMLLFQVGAWLRDRRRR